MSHYDLISCTVNKWNVKKAITSCTSILLISYLKTTVFIICSKLIVANTQFSSLSSFYQIWQKLSLILKKKLSNVYKFIMLSVFKCFTVKYASRYVKGFHVFCNIKCLVLRKPNFEKVRLKSIKTNQSKIQIYEAVRIHI